MPPDLQATLLPSSLKLLKEDTEILHLLFHRNKNQHRSNKWWQWLATLRRHLRKLLADADTATNIKGRVKTKAAWDKVEERMAFMRKRVIRTCYSAFSSVVANNQFAPLGLVLLGVLARVHKIVGPLLPEEEEAVEEEVDEPTTVHNNEQIGDIGVVVKRADDDEDYNMEDRDSTLKILSVPEIIPQREIADPRMEIIQPLHKETPRERPKLNKRRNDDGGQKKKKKRRKKDEIDDLFSGLL